MKKYDQTKFHNCSECGSVLESKYSICADCMNKKAYAILKEEDGSKERPFLNTFRSLLQHFNYETKKVRYHE